MSTHSTKRFINYNIDYPSLKKHKTVNDFDFYKNYSRKCFKMFGKKTENKSTTFKTSSCLLPQECSIPVSLVKRAEIILPYKSFAKKQNKERILKQLKIKLNQRYKFCNRGIAKKLHEIDNELEHIQAVTDFDKEFFTVVNGMPLYHSIPLFKSLKTVLNNHLRTLHEIGYKEDNILNIQINFRLEKFMYDLSLHRFTEQAHNFDKFIMEDYQKSMKFVEEGEKLNIKLDAKVLELQNLADECFSIMSRLISLDYKYSLQQKYGRFLYYLSPPTWRSRNREFARSIEIEAKGFDLGSSNEDDPFTVIFEKIRKECLSSRVKPVLYFSRPDDLVDVFVGIEKQQLYHFSRETQLFPHLKSLKEGIKTLKERNLQDSLAFTISIKGINNLILFCEDQSAQLREQFFKILNGLFYECVGTPEVLRLLFHLEFCYDKVFLEKPMNMDMITMAKAIESMYMDYSNRLDAIQSDTVRRAMKRCMDTDKRKLFRATCAAKELRLFRRLEQELLRAHNLHIKKKDDISSNDRDEKKIICTRSKSQVNDKKRSLTDAEIEYLTLFTDWSKNEDPALYLKSLRMEEDKTAD